MDIAELATNLSAAKTQQAAAIAVLKKVNDVQKQEGQAVLELIKSAGSVSPGPGSSGIAGVGERVDVRG